MKILKVDSSIDFEEIVQEDYEALYATNACYILNKRIKIPYFYDIVPKTFKNELDFKAFRHHYSRLIGANTVFVNDIKLNKYANWLGLNTLWVNQGVDVITSKPKKFFTPKLHIGYKTTSNNKTILEDTIASKKANWVFHPYEDSKEFFEKCQVFLNVEVPYNNSLHSFPNQESLTALNHGCVLVSGNILNNYNHILYDKVNYFNLDFIDSNSIVNTLRYIDKRREKLDRMSKYSNKTVLKYFNKKTNEDFKIDWINQSF